MIQQIVAISFALLAVLAALLWRRHRSRPTAWVAAMFTAIGGALVAANFLEPQSGWVATVVGDAVVVGVVAFPYLLYRFASSFEPPDKRWRRAVEVLAWGMIAAVVVIDPPQQAEQPGAYAVYMIGVLSVWTGLSSWVVWRLWSSGRNLANVARRRMQTLAAAAAMLNVALLMAVLSAGERAAAITDMAYLIALASAVFFYVGFSPPRFLRGAWRRVDERTLWQAEGELMSAKTSHEVVTAILPHVSRLLGGQGALFVDRRGTRSAYGVPHDRAPGLWHRLGEAETSPGHPELDEDLAVLELRGGRLGVTTSAYTPLFGTEELELLEWLGTLADLALSRAVAFDRERQARAQAESLTAELEALVYGISHDLRSPIVSVLGYLDCLQEDYGDRLGDDGRHFLSRMKTNTEYMDSLIGDLLELSRVGRLPGQAEAVAMTDLAEEVAVELRLAHPQATIEVASLPQVVIGKARARQLLTNLLTNALVHSGRPDVTVRVVSATTAAGNIAEMAVIDDGKGIPAPYRQRVFGIFERLGSHQAGDQAGTGIGLAICRKIVEQAGGAIWVADSDNGTDIRVHLPAAVIPHRLQSKAMT